jgi:hypothetical protein
MLGRSTTFVIALLAAIAIPAAATADPSVPAVPPTPHVTVTVTTTILSPAAAAAAQAAPVAKAKPGTRVVVVHDHYKLADVIVKNGKRIIRVRPLKTIRQLANASVNCPPSDGYLHCVHVPLAGPLVNGCNGDVVELQDGSDYQFMDGLTIDPTTLVVTTKNRSNFQGVHGYAMQDGNKYSAADTQKERSSFVPFNPATGASFSQTIDENYELISQGSDPNQVLHTNTVLSVTVHPDFTVDSTTVVTGPDNPCRG